MVSKLADSVCNIKTSVCVVIFLTSSGPGLSQDQTAGESCRQSVKLFYDAPPISTLPVKERVGITQVVLPELKASEAKMGFDTRDLTSEHLSSMLRYKELFTGAAGERVMAVTYQDLAECGNHGQCPAYLIEVGPQGVRSLIVKNGQFGMSVGGAWGAAVMSRKNSVHPDLLFLATISGSEVAVGCYRWQAVSYTTGCDVPCARVLAHPTTGFVGADPRRFAFHQTVDESLDSPSPIDAS